MNEFEPKLGKIVMEAIAIRDQMKAGGMTGAALDAGLADVLRESWPKANRGPWKELCGVCHDYGLEMFDCPGDQTCGRQRAHRPHDYGRPCVACTAGRRHEDLSRGLSVDAELASAAKTSKPTRWGKK